MSPEMVADAAKAFRPKILYPYHFGDTDTSRLVILLKDERVYSRSRMLNKPEGYILDQDHHVHLANQTVSFDWQFLAELLFLEKLENEF